MTYERILGSFLTQSIIEESSILIICSNQIHYLKNGLEVIKQTSLHKLPVEKYDFIFIIKPFKSEQEFDLHSFLEKLHSLTNIETKIFFNLPRKQKNSVFPQMDKKYFKKLFEDELFEVIKSPSISFLARLVRRNEQYLITSNFWTLKDRCNTKTLLPSLSIIIPAKNEEGNIPNIIPNLPKLPMDLEIIFVIGKSEDNTLDIAQQLNKKYSNFNIKVLEQKGVGKADAVWQGFEEAQNELLLILDADLSVFPSEIRKFYEPFEHGEAELVVGTRFKHKMEKNAMRRFNFLGNKFFALLYSKITSHQISDTLCGTKIISKANYQKIRKHYKHIQDEDPFGDFTLLIGADKLHLKIAEIPVYYKARNYGETQISRFRDGLKLLNLIFKSYRR